MGSKTLIDAAPFAAGSARTGGCADGLPDDASVESFRQFIRERGRELYRDLSWRNTQDPYAIWISEVMLQQTQVARVAGRWERFIGRFPTVDALAASSSADVLEEWQGMGYNRRALALHKAAGICSSEYSGSLPDCEPELLALPGIGSATAAGIMAFAYDRPSVYVETNVRAVFIHHFFPDASGVSDKEICALVKRCCPACDVRGWYYALLDYGAYLKRNHSNPARRAKAYSRQSAFEGSRRQKRAWVVREVLACGEGISADRLHESLCESERRAGRPEVEREAFDSIVADLESEGFLLCDGGMCRPAR